MLLDLRALDASFEDVFGFAAPRGQWFAQMLQLSFVGGLTGQYADFIPGETDHRGGRDERSMARRHPLAEAPKAIRYLDEGRVRGKVVITI